MGERSLLARVRLAWFGVREKLFFLRNPDRSSRFNAIYHKRMWQNPESASGFGSTLEATAQAREGIGDLLAEFGISSWLDAPCGDFNWQRRVPFDGHYVGLDIVPDLVAQNARVYGSYKRRFAVADIVADPLPRAELVLHRECLNHLPLADGVMAVTKLAGAATRCLVITHYPEHEANTDQEASFRYRRLNLTLEPFNLRAPDRIIDESEFEPGKVLAVWEIAQGSPFKG